MTDWRLDADVGGAALGETLTVVVTGAPCRLERLMADIKDVVEAHRRAGREADAAPTQRPCGCRDA